MSILGLFTGASTFLVGVEDDPEGGIRCYLGHRANGLYCVIDDPDAIREVRGAWSMGGHVAISVPPAEFIYSEADDAAGASPRTDQTPEEGAR